MPFVGSMWSTTAGDPYWGNVVVLLQGGDGVDYSSYGRTISTSGVTTGSTAWQPEGLDTLLFTSSGFGSAPYVSWSQSSELEWGADDCCIEGDFKFSSDDGQLFRYYVDANGGNSAALLFTPPNASATSPNSVRVNNGALTAVGPAMSMPQALYVCLERVGSSLYCSIDGVSSNSLSIGSGALDVATVASRIGMAAATIATASWTVNVGRYRITVGANRYGGSSFTPPSGAYPTS